MIRKEWYAFVNATQGHNRIVLTEGGIWPIEPDETTAIKVSGEPGLLSLLADRAQIVVDTPEPSDDDEANALKEQFPAEAIIYYYFARQIPQWHEIKPRPEFRSYMQQLLEGYQHILHWDFDFSFDAMTTVHQQLFNRVFDEHDLEFFKNQVGTIHPETIIHEVSKARVEYRDRHIARELIRYWESSTSVFTVYGSYHFYTLEPLITALEQ